MEKIIEKWLGDRLKAFTPERLTWELKGEMFCLALVNPKNEIIGVDNVQDKKVVIESLAREIAHFIKQDPEFKILFEDTKKES